MARCIVSLNQQQKNSLTGKLLASDFAYKLRDYYDGKPTDFPKVDELARYINDEVLPKFFKSNFTPEQAVNFLDTNYDSGVNNESALNIALGELRSSVILRNPQELPSPDYIKDQSIMLNAIKKFAIDRVSAEKAAVNTEVEQAEMIDSSSQGLITENQFTHEFQKNYVNLQAYRQGRFRNSSKTELMMRSKFINDVLLKNALINTDTKELVSTDDVPGLYGRAGSQIDYNLKEYRKNLLRDMLQRLNIPVEYNDNLLNDSEFNNTLKTIEERVSTVKYNGRDVKLSDEGVLTEIAEQLHKSQGSDANLTKILNDFTDYVVLADFNKLFDYYGEKAIKVRNENGDFDQASKKYQSGKVVALDQANVQFTEKIHNGIELSPDLYKTIIEVTPMLSYITGEATDETLYPALVHSTLSKYYGDIDPERGAKSVKEVLLKGLADQNTTFDQKNVIFTLYKRFFEEEGDQPLLHPKNKFNDKSIPVSSFLDTLSLYRENALMNVILKPIQEIAKVHYAEVSERNNEPELINVNEKKKNVAAVNAGNAINDHINKADSTALIAKYKIKFGDGSIVYGDPTSNLEFSLNADGTGNYDMSTVVSLSKDMLNIDFVNNNAHRQFLQMLEDRAGDNEKLPRQYTQFLYDAMKVVQAREILKDPEVQKEIKVRGAKANISGSDVLREANINGGRGWSHTDPLKNTIRVNTVASNAILDILADAENKYAGNRESSVVSTVEGSTVAGYSTHTAFLGLPQTHAHIKRSIESVQGKSFYESPLAGNPFIGDNGLLVRLDVRNAIKIGAEVRGNTATSDLETMTFNLTMGYLDNMAKSIAAKKDITPIFDPATYADKSTNYMTAVRNMYEGKRLFVDSNNQAVHEDVTRQLHFDTVGHYYRAVANNLITDYTKIYNAVGGDAARLLQNEVFSKGVTPSEKLNKLNDLNSVFWKSGMIDTPFEHGLKGFQAMRYYADKAGVDLNNWMHYQNNDKQMKSSVPVVINKDMINYVKLFDSPTDRTAYNIHMDKMLLESAKELMGMGYKFNTQASKAISQLYPKLSSSFKTLAGQARLTRNGHPPDNVGDISPVYRKYFNDYNFVAENILNSSTGGIYAHKGGSVYAKWIAFSKRMVTATASMRKYSLGVENGVETHTRVAMIDDFVTPLKTILGEKHPVVDMDGASLETITQRIKTWNSLNYKYAGDGGPDHKSIFSHIDPHTGSFGLTKHAAFVMDYKMIRNSIGSDIDLMDLHKKLWSTDVSKIDITRSSKEDVNLSHFVDKPVYYFDPTFDHEKGLAGQLYKVEGIEWKDRNELGESVYTIKKRNLSADPNTVLTENNVNIRTMYDLWRQLGHIDSVEPSDTPTAINYENGGSTYHFKPSIRSGEKLVDYECYIGNANEVIHPSKYIIAKSDNDVKAWEVYQKIFGSDGVVSSHVDLFKSYAHLDHTSSAIQNEFANISHDFDLKVQPAEALQLMRDNQSLLANFFNSEDLLSDKYTTKYQRFKGKNIDRLSFAGAQKVGQFNMNDISTLSTKARVASGAPDGVAGITKLLTYKISNLNGGVQLNAWHEAEDSTVTAPTQMLNALSFNGKSIEDVSEIYKALGDLVDKELTYALKDPDIVGKNRVNIPQLVRGLSNAEFYKQNKDQLLRVFHDLLKQTVREDSFTLEDIIKRTFNHASIPIDDSHIFQSAVADLANYFTKQGIRINFDGIFSVLAPSSGMLQFHDVVGGYLPVKAGNGAISYKSLDQIKTTTLNRSDYQNWVAYNEHLEKFPEQKPEGYIAGRAIDIAPRDLRGQQVMIQYADGTRRALSVLRQDQAHLIPEAEALSLVKDQIENYKSILSDDEYKKATPTAKQKLLKDSLDAFAIDFREELSKKGPNTVKFVFDSFRKQLPNLAPDGSDFVEKIYDNFNPNKEYRKQINKQYKAAKDMRNWALSNEYDYLDKLNMVGKVYLGKLQEFLDVASEGKIRPESLTNKELFPYQEGLEGSKIIVSRAETVAPMTAKTSFMMREGDEFGDVDHSFFVSRLKERLDYYDTEADSAIISKFGRRIFIHNRRAPEGAMSIPNTRTIGETTYVTDANNNVQYEIPRGGLITMEGGQLHAYLRRKNDVEILRNNMKVALGSGADADRFSVVELGRNRADRQAKKELAYASIPSQATVMYNSWLKYLDVIGTRIPGQHYQSFQGMKIVGFTEGNKVYVPNEVTLLSGSDFDIDKQNIIYHSVRKDGSLALWHPASRYDTLENIEKSLKLPLQARRTADDFKAIYGADGHPTTPLVSADNSLDMSDLDNLLNVYKEIRNGAKVSEQLQPDILAKLVEYDNFIGREGQWNINPNDDGLGVEMTELNNGILGIKNFAVGRTNSTIENTSNFIYLSKPVSMDTPKLFADNSPKGEAAKANNQWKPNAIVAAKQDNMVGKKVIGITATGLKVLSAISLSTNNELRALNTTFNEMTRLRNEIAELKATDPIGSAGKIDSLQNQLDTHSSNFDYTVDAVRLDRLPLSKLRYEKYGEGFDILTNINLDRISADVLHEMFKRFETNGPAVKEILKNIEDPSHEATSLTLKNYLKTRAVFEDDAAEIISQLLSAATDNAKELILAKINANPDLAGMYATMIMLKVPFEQIVNIMTSPMTEMLIKKGSKNIFDTDTHKNSINNILSMVHNTTAKDSKAINAASLKLSDKYGLYRNTLDDGTVVFNNIENGDVYKLQDLLEMRTIANAGKEVSLLGRTLSINQGVKSNSWDLYKFRTGIEDHISEAIGQQFNFKRYLDSVNDAGGYAERMTQLVSDRRTAFNILHVLSTNPHFTEQLKAYNAASTILELSSYKVATAPRIVERLRERQFLGEHQNVNQDQYKDLEKYIENTVIENFISQENRLPFNPKSSPVFYDGKRELRLTGPSNQKAFAKWVRDVFLDRIQNLSDLRGNEFVQGLTPDNRRDSLMNDIFEFVKLKSDTTNVRSLVQQGKEDSYKYGLKLLYDRATTDNNSPDDTSKNNNIANVLFWYNLILNKNNITKNSYAKLLGEVMGLNEGADNTYRKLMDLKGRIGKNERYSSSSESPFLMTSNGVTFDLIDLFKGYDSFTSDPIARVKKDKPSDEEFTPDADFIDDEPLEEDVIEEPEPEPDMIPDDVEPDADLVDEEGNVRVPKTPLKVKKWREPFGNQGTLVDIRYGGKSVFRGTISAASSLIPHSSENRNTFTYSTDYNYLTGKGGLDISKFDNQNYQKLLHTNMHDLLAGLSDQFPITITLRNGDKVETHEFKPGDHYECI